MQPYQKDNKEGPDSLYGCTVNGRYKIVGITRSAISSFPRRRESRIQRLDSRLRGNDVNAVAEFMINSASSHSQN
jgi:hypothetical protein